MLSDALLLDPQYQALLLVAAATVGGAVLLAVGHGAKARAGAWRSLFEEKRAHIQEYGRTLDAFEETVVMLADASSLEDLPPSEQVVGIIFLLRRGWGPDPSKSDDVVPRMVMDQLPDPRETLRLPPSMLAGHVAEARSTLQRGLQDEALRLYQEANRLRTALALSLRDPDALAPPQAALDDAVAIIFSPTRSGEMVDVDDFMRHWRHATHPAKEALRTELDHASRGIRGLVRVSWAWRFRHSRLHTILAGAWSGVQAAAAQARDAASEGLERARQHTPSTASRAEEPRDGPTHYGR